MRELDTTGIGAVATFLGLVRDNNKGRRVLHLEYEAYEPLALRGLDLIVDRSRARSGRRCGWRFITASAAWTSAKRAWRSRRRRRTGADAFAASRYAIERIKQIVPIWKHEYFEGGDVWIEGATADPDNAEAREEALRIACA